MSLAKGGKKDGAADGLLWLLGRGRESRSREEEKELGRAGEMDVQGAKPGWAARTEIKRGREEK